MTNDDELNDIVDLIKGMDNNDSSEIIESIVNNDETSSDEYQSSFSIDKSSSVVDNIEDMDDTGFVMKPIDTRTIDFTQPVIEDTVEETQIVDDRLSLIVDEYFTKLNSVTNDVLLACQNDRAETQEVIDDLRNRLTGLPNDHPKALVDGLVKALEVKSNINLTAVKMMDTNIKLLSVMKPSIKVNTNINTNSNVSPDELKKLLNSPIPDA